MDASQCDIISVAGNDGATPICPASYTGLVEVVKLLLEMGADGTVANKDGWTPFDAASSNGHVE
jgi:ankyrin repeat protein